MMWFGPSQTFHEYLLLCLQFAVFLSCHIGGMNDVAALQNFLSSMGRQEQDIAAIVNGFKQGLQKQTIATLNFAEFIQCYQWLLKTLHLMEQSHDACELPRQNSMRVLSTSSSVGDVDAPKMPQNGI